MAQFLRPNADESINLWRDSAGNAVDIYREIDESVLNAADFIKVSTSSITARFGLSAGSDPQSSINHIFRVTHGSNNPGEVTIQLTQNNGGDVRATRTFTTDVLDVTEEITLTGVEADSIDWSTGLELQSISGTLPKGVEVYVRWFEFQVPDAPATKARIVGGGLGPIIGGVLSVIRPMFAIPQLKAYSAIDFRRLKHA